MTHEMARTRPADTKLVIASYHRFTLWRAPRELAESVRQRWPEMRVVHLPHYDLVAPEIPDTDIYVGLLLRPDQFRLAKRLKWIHCTSAGVAQLMYPELRRSRIILTNASGVHATTMAEHILGMMVAMARDFPGSIRYQLQRKWGQQAIWDGPARPRELSGEVALLIGFGAVGRAVAERVRALGMRVWAVTRSGHADAALAERVFPATQLDSALPGADFLVLVAPETPETHHLIGVQQLSVMKPSAFLINVARGSLIDQAALIDALERRAIAGAALDVTTPEPLPPENLLWSLENVFITPHTSGISERLWEREGELLIDNLNRWFTGQPLRNQIDFTRGY
jgi:phosphoglycerate dehydrogenase-like enzyme